MVKITHTSVEYEKEPIGVGRTPSFSWKIQGSENGVFQASYHIQVAKDIAFAELVYDETEETEQSVHLQFPKMQLEPMTRYYWHVLVTSKSGETSDFSETTSFVTAYFEPEAWQAKMISPETEADADNPKGSYLRKEFTCEKSVKTAYLCASAYGLYQAYLDGVRVGEDELTPGWTSYHKHLCYQMYDVTKLLSKSKSHCIGAMLGAGYYKGHMGFLGLRNNYGTCTGFLAQLYLVYEDGSTETVVTDETWKAADSPIVFSEIYDGEEYDAGKEIDGWCLPRHGENDELCKTEQGKTDGCCLQKSKEIDHHSMTEQKEADDRHALGLENERWHEVNILDYKKETLTSQFSSRVAEQEDFAPKSIFVTPQGDTVIDFGQNLAGWIHIEVNHAIAGEKVELDCFESLDAAGNVYTDNLRGAKNRLVYICKGGEKEIYHPHFTYQGFRYAKVVSWAGEALSAEKVTAYAVYSKMDYTGSFTCSNPTINQLWSNITWSLRSNFVDIPTDCPQRNERLGWTGDAQIFCRTASYIRGTYHFFDKWLTDVACDMTKDGGVPHVVPDLITPHIDKVNDWLCSQGTHSASAWADVIVLNPWNVYLTYGDKRILTERYEDMKKWISFMEAHAVDDMWTYRLQFGDWVALDAEEGSYFGATPTDLTCTAYYAHSTEIVAKVAKILGYDEDAAYYEALGKRIKEAFVKHYFDPETKGMTVQTQTAHILALYFQLTPEEYKEKTVEELVELLQKENGHLVTGFMGTPYFTHALSENGHIKEAYELLLKDDFPSWLYQVKAGATTIWEHWDGLKPDGTMWSADMNSFNHYAYGAIGEWLIRTIVGIDFDEARPGYQHVNLTPQPGGGLTDAKGVFESVYGTVECSWKSEGDEVLLHIQLPPNTSGTLYWTGNGEEKVIELENGVFDFKMQKTV